MSAKSKVKGDIYDQMYELSCEIANTKDLLEIAYFDVIDGLDSGSEALRRDYRDRLNTLLNVGIRCLEKAEITAGDLGKAIISERRVEK